MGSIFVGEREAKQGEAWLPEKQYGKNKPGDVKRESSVIGLTGSVQATLLSECFVRFISKGLFYERKVSARLV